MTKAQLALHISLISRIAAQYTHEMAFGMWNPDFCSSDAEYVRERFVTEMQERLENLRTPVSTQKEPS